MAGSRETPAERLSRQESHDVELWVPEGAVAGPEAVEVVEAPPEQAYGRRSARGEQRAVVAAAFRVPLDDRRQVAAMRLRRQGWQSEAWEYATEVPETGNVLDYIANLLSKLRLYSAVRPDPSGPPVPVDDEAAGVDPTEAKIAQDTLERLRSSQGGQSAIVADIAFNFEVTGEGTLHGHEDPATGEEDWNFRSIDELVVQGDRYMLRVAPGSNAFQSIPEGDIVIRLWLKDRRFSQLATCAMRRCLSVSENLLLLDRELRSTSSSRLPNGLLILSQDYSFGPVDPTRDGGDGEARDDPFLADLDEAMRTAIQEPGAASAAQPIVIQAPYAQVKDGANYIKLGRELDATLEARIEGQVLRLARGLSMPVEVARGLFNTTFANAAQVRASEWESYGEPKATAIVDALTAGYYQWMLVEQGIPADRARRHFIWYDPTDCLATPDPVDYAEKDHEDGVISDEARRRLHGHSEADAPTDDELLRRILLHATRLDPFVLAQLLKSSGLAPDIEIPAPQGGTVTTPPASVTAAGVPSGRQRGLALGRALVALDRDLRSRLQVAAEGAMRRTLERAGNKTRGRVSGSGSRAALRAQVDGLHARKVTAALGPTVVASLGLTGDDLLDGAFDDLAEDWRRWVPRTQKAALAALAAHGVELDDPAREELAQAQERHAQEGWEAFAGGLIALAGVLLFRPEPGAPTPGEDVPDSLVPVGLVRQALAVAGGDQPTGGGGEPLRSGVAGGAVGGVASGVDVLGPVGGVEGYVWDWGTADRVPFEPHEALNGQFFETWDDPVLENDTGWPDAYCYPGDRDSCCCDAAPVLSVGGSEEE